MFHHSCGSLKDGLNVERRVWRLFYDCMRSYNSGALAQSDSPET